MVSYTAFTIISLIVLLIFAFGRIYQQEKTIDDLLAFIQTKQESERRELQRLQMKQLEVEERAC